METLVCAGCPQSEENDAGLRALLPSSAGELTVVSHGAVGGGDRTESPSLGATRGGQAGRVEVEQQRMVQRQREHPLEELVVNAVVAKTSLSEADRLAQPERCDQHRPAFARMSERAARERGADVSFRNRQPSSQFKDARVEAKAAGRSSCHRRRRATLNPSSRKAAGRRTARRRLPNCRRADERCRWWRRDRRSRAPGRHCCSRLTTLAGIGEARFASTAARQVAY